MDIRYPATVERQPDGSYFVQFVDLEDTFTEGQTEEEALFNAAEALSAMLAWRLARGERTLSELARALETSWPAAKRLEDPTHWPSLKTLERAAAALGKRLVLTLE
jgi:antitoxin HicB